MRSYSQNSHVSQAPLNYEACMNPAVILQHCRICLTQRYLPSQIRALREGSSHKTAETENRRVITIYCYYITEGALSSTVEELCYKPEGLRFESRWCHWIFLNLSNPSSRTMPLTEMSTRKRGEERGRRSHITSHDVGSSTPHNLIGLHGLLQG
jgi:hypothetical protein